MTMWAEQSGRRLQATEGGLGGNQTYRCLALRGVSGSARSLCCFSLPVCGILILQFQQSDTIVCLYLCYKHKWLCLTTQWRPNRLKHWHLEKRQVYYRATQMKRMGGSCSENPNSLIIFMEEFLNGKVRGEGCKVCDFILISWQ